MAVPQSQRDAHNQALRWAHVLQWQIDRLRSSRPEFVESSRRAASVGIYEMPDLWPAWQMDAEKHFTLTAARQLLRALRAFDGDDRLPATLSSTKVGTLRDALEHWDEPQGSAARRMAALGADATSHEWLKESGHGFLGGLVTDESLRQWAADVYAELVAWDPW